MTKVYTEFDEIRDFLDDMITNETKKRDQLKKQIDELRKQDSSKSVTNDKTPEQNLIKDDDVKLHFGTKSFQKILKPNAKINDLYSLSRINLGTDLVGYKDANDHDSITYLRKDQDLKYAFTFYFAENIPFLHIVALKQEDSDAFKKLNFRKESIIPNTDYSVFKLQILGPDSALIFFAIPSKYNKQEGMTYLQSIFNKDSHISELSFKDEDGDIIIIDSDEAWNYCISASSILNKKGKYPRLIITLS